MNDDICQRYRYQDATALPRVHANQLETSSPAGVLIEPPGKERIFKRRAPEFYEDPDHVQLLGSFSEDSVVCPPAFVATASNARIVGFRSILTENGLFFNDDSTLTRSGRLAFLESLALPDPLNEQTGLRPSGAEDQFVLDQGHRSIQHIAGTTVFLSSAEPANYGSWIFRVLPKLHTLRQVGLRQPVTYLVWAEVPTFQEYLQTMGILDDHIVHFDPKNLIYELDRVIVPSMRNNQAFLDPASLALFSELRNRLGYSRQPGTRIYVSRALLSQSGWSRAMLNEEALVERLVDLGFRIVAPETLSVEEQIIAFSSADMVVGPAGSGMFNVVFCHPGTKVIDIESEPHWIHAHRSLFASCNLRYGIFAGDCGDRDFRNHHKPWRVNINALISRIESFYQQG